MTSPAPPAAAEPSPVDRNGRSTDPTPTDPTPTGGTPTGGTGPGAADVLSLFRGNDVLTRADVMTLSGLSRSTVNQRIDVLLEAALITPAVGRSSARGRPPEQFAFNRSRGFLLVADVGATGMRAAVCDLAGDVLLETDAAVDLSQGPEHLLSAVDGAFEALLAERGVHRRAVLGVGLDVPGPVDFARGQVVSPPIMNGWDGFDIRGWFRPRYACPVLVENDVNAMTWGEQRVVHPDVSELLMLKLGTGVGAGLVTGSHLFRGADGAAGDIGHLHAFVEGPEPECRCGRFGCVEAYAGGWALVRDLNAAGIAVADVDAAVQLLLSGNLTAVGLARRAARVLGEAVAQAVSLFNPQVIVLAGQLSAADEHLLAGIREVIYQRSLPLATRNLRIVPSRLGRRAGAMGLALLLADTIFAPAQVEGLVAGR